MTAISAYFFKNIDDYTHSMGSLAVGISFEFREKNKWFIRRVNIFHFRKATKNANLLEIEAGAACFYVLALHAGC